MNNNLICVIDDDEDVRAVMCYALEFEGLRTLPLSNGKEALDYLSHVGPSEYPALIILDYHMPEMDGLEFIQKIKNNFSGTLGKIPLALSSARDSLGTEGEVPDEVFLLSKPVDLKDLLRLARMHCPEELLSGSSF